MNVLSRISRALYDTKVFVTEALGAVPLDVRVAALLFSKHRSEYYQYLSDLIEGSRGKKLMLAIFKDDAKRYSKTSRGTLSAHWAAIFDKEGGKLSRTFAGTLPSDEVMLLHMLQKRGGEGVFAEGLAELAENTALVQRAVSTLLGALMTAAFPIALLVGMLILIPLYTVPEIKSGFSMVPPSLYPPKAVQLFTLSDFISNNGFLLILGAMGLVALVIWSLSRLRGPVRKYFDKYLIIWGIYRDFQGIKFLSSLSLVLKNRNNETSRLKDAVEMQLSGSSPWKESMIRGMLKNIADGKPVVDVFKVGMFDRDMEFTLEDLIASRGLNSALVYLRPKLEKRVMGRLKKRCNILSWSLIGMSALFGIYLMALHTLATNGLQQAMQLNLN